jgi:hypothetical protein
MTITPLNGRFPLNGIFLPDGRTVRSELAGPWRRLWRRAGAENIEAAVLDFLDGDGEPRLGGGERDGYLNRPLLSLNELLFVPGMTADILYGTETRPGIAPLVTLRSDGKINANTALPEVLALLDGLDGNIAADLVRARETRVFTSMEDLSAVPSFPASARAQLMNVLSFTSSHFRVSFTVGFADGQKTPWRLYWNEKVQRPRRSDGRNRKLPDGRFPHFFSRHGTASASSKGSAVLLRKGAPGTGFLPGAILFCIPSALSRYTLFPFPSVH